MDLIAHLRSLPDDWDSWLVFADQLTERGDDRGELLVREHRGEPIGKLADVWFARWQQGERDAPTYEWIRTLAPLAARATPPDLPPVFAQPVSQLRVTATAARQRAARSRSDTRAPPLTCGGKAPATSQRPTGTADRVRFEPQIGHAGKVKLVDLSDDGRYALTAARSAKVWDVETGAVMRTIDNPTNDDFDVAEFAGGTGQHILLARTAADGTVTGGLYDALTGELKTSLSEEDVERQKAATRSEKTYAFLIEESIEVHDTATGREIANVNVGKDVMDAEVTTDGSLIVVGTSTGLAFYDVATGKRIHADFETGPQDKFAVQPNGHGVCGASGSDFTCWNVTTTDIKHATDFELPVYGKVFNLAFAGNRFLLVNGIDFHVADLQPGGSTAFPSVFTFGTRDGVRLIKYGNLQLTSDALEIYDLAKAAVIKKVPASPPASLHSASWSPDGRRLAVNGTIWDIANLRVERRFFEYDRDVELVRFVGNDQLRAIVDDRATELWLIDAATGTHRAERLPTLSHAWMSRDGRDFYGAVYEGEEKKASFEQWETSTGRQVAQSSSSGLTAELAVARDYRGSRVPDGGNFPWVAATQFELRDLRTGKTVLAFPLRKESTSPSLSGDGKRLSVVTSDAVEIWDVATQKLQQTLATPMSAQEWVDADRLLVGQPNGTIGLWDVTTGKAVWSKRDHGSNVTDFAVAPDRKRAASTSSDGTTRLWRLDTGESLALVSVGDDWIVYDNDGYFDASKQGSKLVAAIEGDRAYRIDQLAARNNRPDLLLAKLGLGDPVAIEHFRALHDRRLERAKLDQTNLAAAFKEVPTVKIVDERTTGKRMTITFEIAATAELRSYNVWANGVPLLGDGKPISGRTARLTETVELTRGSNRVEVGAIDRRGGESLRPYRRAEYGDRRAKPTDDDDDVKPDGDLYYLAFGVSTYRNAAFNLAYAHKDVTDLAEVLRRSAGYGKVHVEVITNRDATVEAIRGAKQFLASATVDDTVVLFVAGHGLHARDKSADYYFATHEVDLDNLPRTAAPFEVIEDLLQGIAPRRKLFLMDTCESGDVDPGQQAAAVVRAGARGLTSRALVRVEDPRAPAAPAPGPKPREYLLDRDRFIYADLFRRSGAIVLSSSHGTESSYELDELKNGAFTEAILRALTGVDATADADGDKRLSTLELVRALARDVPARTNGLQHPSIDRDNLDILTTLPLVPSAQDVVGR